MDHNSTWDHTHRLRTEKTCSTSSKQPQPVRAQSMYRTLRCCCAAMQMKHVSMQSRQFMQSRHTWQSPGAQSNHNQQNPLHYLTQKRSAQYVRYVS